MKLVKKQKEVVEEFKLLDKNNNGYLTPGELKLSHLDLPMGNNIEYKRKLANMADTNKDGKISLKEYFQFMMPTSFVSKYLTKATPK